ncbi:MAG: hypothetical protein RSB09_05730, partial [Clostridia bacterium]
MDNDNIKKLEFERKPKSGKIATIFIVQTALMAASLTALKFALSFIPNVEVVTVLIMVYATTFGFLQTFVATLVFCAVEVGIYGVGTWVLLYFIYWPLLAFLASALLKRGNVVVAVVVAGIMSALFGLLSACADTLLLSAGLSSADLSKYFVAYYLRG